VNFSFSDLLWDMKGDIFTSLIITIIINASRNIARYSEIIKKQHVIYTDAMHDFTGFLSLIYKDEIWYYYMPLYNSNCLFKTIQYLKSVDFNENLNKEDFHKSLVCEENRIDELLSVVKEEKYIFKDTFLLREYLVSAKDLLEKNEINNCKKVESLLYKFYNIIECLRYLWRRDVDIDRKIISVLDKYPVNHIEMDFYLRMWLDDFDFKVLRTTIEQMRIFVNKVEHFPQIKK